MIDSVSAALGTLASFLKGMWQIFIIPVGITAWAIYRDILAKQGRRENKEQTKKQNRDPEHEDHIVEISARHQEYMSRIEGDFQELLKQLNDTEAEIALLRREKWQTDLQVRAWRHACRDAQQIVWALQRQGCAAGSELTRFKPVDSVFSQNVSANQHPPEVT